jgi:hypothetical protein
MGGMMRSHINRVLLTVLSLFMAFSVFHSETASAQISLDQFAQLKSVFEQEFGSELKARGQILAINPDPSPSTPNFWWNLDTVRASYSSYTAGAIRTHFVYVLGGYARLQGMTVDGIAATLCHELGHGIAGPPYKNRKDSEPVSVEGQADDFAYRTCLPRILRRLPATSLLAPVSSFTDSVCRSQAKDAGELAYCTRIFHILEVERLFFRANGDGETSYQTPDRTVAARTETREDYYPPAQCRIDTMMAAIFGKPRPVCWFAGL